MTDSPAAFSDPGPALPDARGATLRLRATRAFLRSHVETTPVGDVVKRIAYQLYLVAVLGGLWGYAVVQTLRDDPGAPPGPSPAAAGGLDAVAAVAMAVALVGTVAAVRIGTWAGPVLLSRPDVAWLLPAPLDRRRLLRPSLAWGVTGFTVIGALVGLVLGLVVAVEGDGGVLVEVGATTVGWAGLGALAAAGSFAAERSRRLSRLALRGTFVLVAVGAVVMAVAVQRPDLAVWIPPWGWAVAPIASGAGVTVAGAGVLPLLLIPVAVVAVRWAAGRLDTLPDEELVRRAGVATGVKASAAVFDARAIAQARRTGQQWLVGHRRVRIRRPRRRALLIVWRDAVSLLRRRGLVERTVVAVAAAAGLVAWSQSILAGLVAVLILSATAGQLLEPLRIELEEPVAGDLTPFSPADLALEHLVVPTVAMSSCGIGVVAVALGTGGLAAGDVAPALAGVVALGVLVVAAAALASTRGAPPLHLLAQGEYGAMMLFGWALAGPLLALGVAGAPVAAAIAGRSSGRSLAGMVPSLLVLAAVAAAILVALVRWRARRATEPE